MTSLSRRASLALPILLPILLTAACNSASGAAVIAPQADVADSSPPVSVEQLRAAASDPAARRFYEADGWRPLWSPAAQAALERSLAGRSRHALDRVAFLPDGTVPADATQREVTLTLAALHYAEALAHGVSDPALFHPSYAILRPRANLGAALAQALADGKLEAWLDSLAPQGARYTQLSRAYLVARQEIGGSKVPLLSAGIIHVGDLDRRVPVIVGELVGGGYLDASNGVAAQPAGAAMRYTHVIARAVTRLQRDYGMTADGIVGPTTLEVLNLRPGDRAQALAVALERLRWLTRTPPPTRIDVNTAAARLSYFRDGKLVESRKVIVGRPGRETPPLRAPIFRLVANPTWTVPRSIQRSEMASVSPRYLRRHHMFRRGSWIVQSSGPHNALGMVKFDMRDDDAIYLHDTSARALFARSQRHLSHGCVRVEDALGFARRIAADEGVTDQWERARASGRQSFVPLPREIPVRLLYHNVFVDADGRIAFRTDPYGWNAPVARALGYGTGSRLKARAAAVDVGP